MDKLCDYLDTYLNLEAKVDSILHFRFKSRLGKNLTLQKITIHYAAEN